MVLYINENVIEEGLSKSIYHFTSLGTLSNIVKKNCMYLKSELDSLGSDIFSKSKIFYLCFTRVGNSNFGYSQGRNVRIEFDGNALSYNYSGKPISYWRSETSGKHDYFSKKKVDYNQSRTENEDRLFSKEPVIRNIKKYIKRIDVLVNPKEENDLIYAAKLCNKENIYIYDNKKDFDNRSDNTLNAELNKDYNLFIKQPNGYFADTDQIYGYAVRKIVTFILLNEYKMKDYNKEAMKLLKHYGLENYKDFVLNNYSRYWSIEDYIHDAFDCNSSLFTPTMGEDYVRVMKMFSDYCYKHNITNKKDAIEYKESISQNRKNEYDWNKTLDVLAFAPRRLFNYIKNDNSSTIGGAVVVLNPSTTCIWDIEELNENVRPFLDENLLYYVNSFKSKNRESFRKYIQHIAKSNKITVNDYIDFANKIDMEEDAKKDYLFNGGGFLTVTLTVSNSIGEYSECEYLNDEERNEVEKYFIKSKNLKENIEDEVRYIDTDLIKQGKHYQEKASKKSFSDIENQEPIKNGESIRLFHGCDLKTAVQIAKEGVSGKEWHPRRYSYESGMNPIGLFVTSSFYTAKEFSNPFNSSSSHKAAVIIEFSAKSNDLDTPVWNNSNSYFGQGSNPMPFKDKEERNAQKEKYRQDAMNSESDYVRLSDNPAMASNIFDNAEHQALFIGDLSPNMIKRFWVKDYDKNNVASSDYIPMKRVDFLKKFGNDEFAVEGYFDMYSQVKGRKLYLPTEDFISWEDFARREVLKHDMVFLKSKAKRKYNGDLEKCIEDSVKEYTENIKEYLGINGNDVSNVDYSYLAQYMWPKQLRQVLGKEEYEKHFDRLGIGYANESKKHKRVYINEDKLQLLKEGYSSKNLQDDILQLAQKLYDELINQGKTFSSADYVIRKNGKLVKVVKINARIAPTEYACVNKSGVSLEIAKTSSLNTLQKLLMHEMTHIFDEIKDKETNFNQLDMYENLNIAYNIPNYIADIIYHLWIPTEFNAFQVSYDFEHENFNAMIDDYMYKIKQAYELPTTHSTNWKDDYETIWKSVRKALKKHIPNKYNQSNIDKFKKYFVTNSLALLKKLVKKWNGKQNVNFENKNSKNILKENISSVVYHFTDFESFAQIAETNSLKMSRTNAYAEADNDFDRNDVNNEINGKYNYYISFTRSPNSKLGFSQWLGDNPEEFGSPTSDGIVRIELDGDMFNQRRDKKAVPMDFFSKQFRNATPDFKSEKALIDKVIIPKNNQNTSSKETQLNSISHFKDEIESNQNDMWYDDTQDKKTLKKHTHPSYVQNEDRFMTNTPDKVEGKDGYITDFSKYVTRVDIFLHDNSMENQIKLNNLLHNSQLGKENKIHIQTDMKSFDRFNKDENMRIKD